jgi:hypothetical protein
MKEIIYTEIDLCGVDKQGNNETIPKLNPPSSQDMPEKI